MFQERGCSLSGFDLPAVQCSAISTRRFPCRYLIREPTLTGKQASSSTYRLRWKLRFCVPNSLWKYFNLALKFVIVYVFFRFLDHKQNRIGTLRTKCTYLILQQCDLLLFYSVREYVLNRKCRAPICVPNCFRA